MTSSLREFDRPADRIRQHRQASDDPILIVEGEGDLLTLRPALPGVEIFPADGKQRVVDAARTLISWKIEKFICITDNDFDDPELLSDLDHVHHPYDGTDLESMLIGLGVLASLLEHVGSLPKLSAIGGASNLVAILIKSVRPLTSLRVANAKNGWGLPFDEVQVADKIDKKTLEMNVASYCSALRNKMDDPIDQSILLQTAQALHANPKIFRGKDVVAAAGVALRKRAGALQQAASDPDYLCAQLHSSSGLALTQSDWYVKLKHRIM